MDFALLHIFGRLSLRLPAQAERGATAGHRVRGSGAMPGAGAGAGDGAVSAGAGICLIIRVIPEQARYSGQELDRTWHSCRWMDAGCRAPPHRVLAISPYIRVGAGDLRGAGVATGVSMAHGTGGRNEDFRGQRQMFDNCAFEHHNLAFPGEVPEWLKGADCKSVGLRLRWFESNPLHHPLPGWRCNGSHPPHAGPCIWRDRLVLTARSRCNRAAGLAGSRPGRTHRSGCSSMVEQKPSKLTTRVRFPSPAPLSAIFPLFIPVGLARPWLVTSC